jgi:hypothetical protein
MRLASTAKLSTDQAGRDAEGHDALEDVAEHIALAGALIAGAREGEVIRDRLQRPCGRTTGLFRTEIRVAHIDALLSGDVGPVRFVPRLALDLQVRSFVPS